MSVYLLGFLHCPTMFISSSLNPISRSRSASSRTRTSTSSKVKPLVLCIWSIRRPVVATIMSGLSKLIYLFSSFKLFPPNTARELKFFGMYFAKLWSIEWHCAASSLVGWRIKYLSLPISVALVWDSLIHFWRIGSKKEADLPDPVTEWARMSLPSKIAGTTFLWMIVGCSYSRSEQAFTRGLASINSWNWIKSSLS